MEGLLNFKVIGQPSLERLVKQLPVAIDTTAILDEGAAVLYNRMRTRFLQEVDPNSEAWPRSKAAIERSERGRGGGTLYDTGKLFRSIQLYAESETSRAIGTNVTNSKGFPYPLVHQYGSANLPRRQFLGFGDEDIRYMSSLVIRRITEAFK